MYVVCTFFTFPWICHEVFLLFVRKSRLFIIVKQKNCDQYSALYKIYHFAQKSNNSQLLLFCPTNQLASIETSFLRNLDVTNCFLKAFDSVLLKLSYKEETRLG